MKKINVLIQAHNTCGQNSAGGVQTRIFKIQRLLNGTGKVSCQLFSTFESKLSDFDILHVFTLNSENYSLITYAKNIGLKVVISPIIALNTGKQVDFHRIVFSRIPIYTTYKLMLESVCHSDLIIAETPREKDFLIKHYKTDSDRVRIIPNGAEVVTYNGKDIYEYLGKECKFILLVGRFDLNKNQLNIIKALKDTGIDIVFVGGAAGEKDTDYYDLCRRSAEGYDNIHFLGWLSNDSLLLQSAYRHADTFVFPSINESFGMTLIEAGMAGAKVVISNTLSILDYSAFKECNTFFPTDVNSIKQSVLKTYNDRNTGYLRDRIIRDFSLEKVIDTHINLYRQTLGE